MMPLIAIDGMGGDYAPQAVVEGLAIFHQRCPHCSFLIFGDEDQLNPLLRTSIVKAVSEVVHTPEAISGSMTPSQALRLKGASMRLALEAVAQEKAAGAVSAGNTGAYLALSRMILKTITGVDRPAIASQLPTQRGESVMMDLGGSLTASAKNLVDYALMGNAFAQCVLGISSPTIGLLNVGREDSKGHDILQEAFAILKGLPLQFHGFIEGDDIGKGSVDVIITDGFTGNVALKMGEGTVRLLMTFLKRSFRSSLYGQFIGWLARPFFKELRAHLDPRSYNGAVWLGLKGIAVKSHGGTDALGFAHAVEMAYDMIASDINGVIARSLIPLQKAEAS